MVHTLQTLHGIEDSNMERNLSSGYGSNEILEEIYGPRIAVNDTSFLNEGGVAKCRIFTQIPTWCALYTLGKTKSH